MNNINRKVCLSTLSPITDKTLQVSLGRLSLILKDKIYYLSWKQINKDADKTLNLCYDCTNLQTLHLTEEKNKIIIILVIRNNNIPRIFELSNTKLILLGKFLEQLIINKILVPENVNDNNAFIFTFLNSYGDDFPYKPINIRPNFEDCMNLYDLWMNLQKFIKDFLIRLNYLKFIDSDYPLALIASSSHKLLVMEIMEYINKCEKIKEMDEFKFNSFFDESGRINNKKEFLKIIYYGGVNEKIVRKVLPFLFELYDFDSTYEERNMLDEKLKKEFNALLNQMNLYEDYQVDNNRKMSSNFRVILQDISRTDRELNAFKNENGVGLKSLTTLLKIYSLYNPPIGYIQGMNDLFVPILFIFFSNWDEEGNPIDDNGNIISVDDKLPMIFWYFDSMICHLDHYKILKDMAYESDAIATKVYKILKTISPLSAIWLKNNCLHNLLWLYPEFLLLFKRTYSYIWPIWLKLHSSPDPKNWLIYFVSSILIFTIDSLMKTENITITKVMDSFQDLLKELDIQQIGLASIWISNKVKLPSEETNPKVEETYDFKYFKTEWI